MDHADEWLTLTFGIIMPCARIRTFIGGKVDDGLLVSMSTRGFRFGKSA
jgi:hypothetical protein